MVFQKERYPSNWKQISHEIRFVRAGGCCEYPGCGVKHGAIGARDADGNWYDEAEIQAMSEPERYALWWGGVPKLTKIILTTAHLGVPKPDGSLGDKHDKMDCRPENLASYCQKHHLAYDMDEHIANRKVTLAKKREKAVAATGQQSFLEDL